MVKATFQTGDTAKMASFLYIDATHYTSHLNLQTRNHGGHFSLSRLLPRPLFEKKSRESILIALVTLSSIQSSSASPLGQSLNLERKDCARSTTSSSLRSRPCTWSAIPQGLTFKAPSLSIARTASSEKVSSSKLSLSERNAAGISADSHRPWTQRSCRVGVD